MSLRGSVKRAIPAPLEPSVRAALTRYRLARGSRWGRDRALRVEVDFWERWIARGGVKLEERLDRRLTDRAVIECLRRIPEPEVEIVDVGAGPLTTLGTDFAEKRVSLTAVDPLADHYDRVLHKVGITPPVRTTQCAGEDLLGRFGADRFDLVFCENALDHTPDPLAILTNMFGVVKPGRFVVLNHFRNEAEHASYGQLHQWNFDEQGGRCWLWRDQEHRDVGEFFSGRAVVACRREQQVGDARERVICVITKNGDESRARRE
jgi:SAM-dependent methyltransferase